MLAGEQELALRHSKTSGDSLLSKEYANLTYGTLIYTFNMVVLLSSD